MRVFIFLLMFLGSLGAQAANAPAKFEIVSLFGKDYVRITDWSRATHFHLQWIQKEKLLRATNSTARLMFEIDSDRAQVNGVNLALSLPVILQKGTVYISRSDLQNTLQPILFPEKNPTNSPIKTICIDPGHGGKDPGKIDGRMLEKNCTLLLSEELERILKQAGFKVVRTRTRDTTLELADRPRFANEKDADLFVSLHFNADGNHRVEGIEVYSVAPAGTLSSNGGKTAPAYLGHSQMANNTLLAYEMQKKLVNDLDAFDRGAKRSQFVVLLSAKMPAILIEGGFMTNPSEARKIYSPAYRKKMAQAIADGILSYQKIVEKSAPLVSAKTK